MYVNATIISIHLRVLCKRVKFFFNCFNAFPIKYIFKKKIVSQKGTEMATHSSILARRIPWTEEPGRLQSMGLQRVGHN